jgi:hypothetical protein
MFVGAIDGFATADGEAHVLIEATPVEGVVTAPLSKYRLSHVRIWPRPRPDSAGPQRCCSLCHRSHRLAVRLEERFRSDALPTSSSCSDSIPSPSPCLRTVRYRPLWPSNPLLGGFLFPGSAGGLARGALTFPGKGTRPRAGKGRYRKVGSGRWVKSSLRRNHVDGLPAKPAPALNGHVAAAMAMSRNKAPPNFPLEKVEGASAARASGFVEADQDLEKAAGSTARGELRGFSLSRASAFGLGSLSHSGCFLRSSISRSTESVTLRAAPVMKCLDK